MSADEHKVAMIRDAIETAKRQKEIHSDRIDVELRLVEQHAVKLDAQVCLHATLTDQNDHVSSFKRACHT
eukprot:13858-Eustigmatos_ZCMA.PRE.1